LGAESDAICPSCGHRAEAGATECPACGDSQRVLCERCQATIAAFVKVCPECGSERRASRTASPRRRARRIVALLLVLVAAGAIAFVVHRSRRQNAPAPVRLADVARALDGTDFERARSLCERRIDERGEDARTLLSLGRALRALGDHEAALKATERSVELDPSDGIALAELSRMLLRRGEPKRALDLARRAGKLLEHPGPAHLVIGKILARAGAETHEAARRHLGIASESGVADADGHALLAGLILREPGDLLRSKLTAEQRVLTRARAALRPLADAEDAPGELRLLFARLQLALGAPEDALERLRRLRSMRTLPAVDRLVEIECLVMLERTEEARRAALDLAAAGESSDLIRRLAALLRRTEHSDLRADGFLLLAWIEEKEGSPERALDHYHAALRERPDDLTALNNLAGLLAEAGVKDGMAGRLALRATELGPECAQAWDTLGTARMVEGRVAEALTAYRRAADLYAKEIAAKTPAPASLERSAARTALRMALAHHRLGEPERCAELRKQARKLWPAIEKDPVVSDVVAALP